MTGGWAAARDWVDERGGINLAFLAERFGDAQIWATECTRYMADIFFLSRRKFSALL